jgi:hypothetical protein
MAFGLAIDKTGRDEPGKFTTRGTRARPHPSLDLAQVEPAAGPGHQEGQGALPNAGPADGQIYGKTVLNHEDARYRD